MPDMADPHAAMLSFQQALTDGEIQLRAGDIDREIFVFADKPNGLPLFSYVRLDKHAVTVFVNLAVADPIEGVPCFQIGYVVAKALRGKGRAEDAVKAALAELKNGLSRANITTFYVEAVVAKDNEPSKHVAAAVISPETVEITDQASGVPALQYLRKIEPDTAI
jgi:RimJ/RimL family protein N-acetyltransferase